MWFESNIIKLRFNSSIFDLVKFELNMTQIQSNRTIYGWLNLYNKMPIQFDFVIQHLKCSNMTT